MNKCSGVGAPEAVKEMKYALGYIPREICPLGHRFVLFYLSYRVDIGHSNKTFENDYILDCFLSIIIVTGNHDENSMLYVMVCGMSYEREVRLEAKKMQGKRRERSSEE